MKDKWDSCILQGSCEKNRRLLQVYPGEPEWRNTIVDTTEVEVLEKSNADLTKMVQELTQKVRDLTNTVEQLTMRLI
jgi:uncharacterized protein YlxW (UPF0749 family)